MPTEPPAASSAAAAGASSPPRVHVHEERAASIVTANRSPDIPFAWSVNPYRGCTHACAYCYARRTHEYLDLGAGSDFETELFVKTNAAELLDAALARPGWRREALAFSGVTDCYQPVETRYRLTRACLEVCVRRANPAMVTTKSALVAQDAALLAELDRRQGASVWFTLTFASDDVSRLLEPGASSLTARLGALRTLRAAGVPVGALVAPVIPGLNDRDIPVLLERAAEAGAEVASFSPVRLPGSVAEVFLGRLRTLLPDAAARVEARIRDLRGGLLNDPRLGHRMDVGGPYWESIRRLFETTATRLGLDGGQSWRKRVCPPPQAGPKQLELFS